MHNPHRRHSERRYPSNMSFLRLPPSPSLLPSASYGGSPASRHIVRCALSVVLAFVLFTILFLWAGAWFWPWLTLSVLALCCAAMLAEPNDMRGVLWSRAGTCSTATTLLLGISAAMLLYGIFFLDNLAARRFFPFDAVDL